MKKVAVMLSFIAALALPGRLLAHEGHEHKLMGTVTQVHAGGDVSHVEVKTTDGKAVTITCDDQTRFLRGKAAASLKDVQVGSRIVATVTEEGQVTKASQVVVGAAGTSDPAAQHNPHKH